MLGPYESNEVAEQVCDMVGGGQVGRLSVNSWVVIPDAAITNSDLELCPECNEYGLAKDLVDVTDLPLRDHDVVCTSCANDLAENQDREAYYEAGDYLTDLWRNEGIYGIVSRT